MRLPSLLTATLMAVSVAVYPLSMFEPAATYALSVATDPTVPNLTTGSRDGAVQLLAERRSRAKSGRAASVSASSVIVVPACDGNQPTLVAPRDAMCSQAVVLCESTPDPADAMFWFFVGPSGLVRPRPNSWTLARSECLQPGSATRSMRPAMTLRDFRRLPLPAGQIHIEPGTLRTLVNVETNFFVGAEAVEIPTTLLGFSVRVRAKPIRYQWHFGDGETLRTSDPGAPYPDLRTTHTYAASGELQVRLSTTYTGEYSVLGGPWLPVLGEAIVSGPAVSLTVVEVRALLVEGASSEQHPC